MRTLFQREVAEDVKRRLMMLRADSWPQWGGIAVGQMLMHCRMGLLMATGEVRPARTGFPGNVLGLGIKRLAFGNEKPMRRNSPTAPELFPEGSAGAGFEDEREKLIRAIDGFVAAGAAGCTEGPHPFFGTLTPEEWAELMWKHLDHHLRQFGVSASV